MQNRNLQIPLHIIGCIVFLALPLIFAPHPPDEIDFIYSKPTLRDFITNGLLLLFFYLNFYLLIPELYFRKRYVIYGICICVSLVVICLLPSLSLGHIPWQSHPSPVIPFNTPQPPALAKPPNFSFLEEIKHHIYLFASVVLFSILLRTRSRLFQTEQERHQAELNSLKAQINPHFLFNTLNSIYAFAIREKAPLTATSILKISGMMRYVVTETGNGYISLDKEISYINDYVELQRLRLDKRIELSYTVNGNSSDPVIAPLVLIPFIENAFKHGVNPDQNSHINITIEIQESELKLIVENNKVNAFIESHMKSGKGIENTKSRLELLYPGKHLLILSEDEKHFRVQLIIQLK
jgi:hypothetical protein